MRDYGLLRFENSSCSDEFDVEGLGTMEVVKMYVTVCNKIVVKSQHPDLFYEFSILNI